MSYIGNEPIVSATRTITEVTATAGQTVFTANGGYTVGYIDVFLNGAQLQTVDFTATNGSSITLTEAAQVGDVLKLVAWGTFSTSNLVSPNYTGTLTGGTGVVNIGSGQVYKDASGNLGIGTSSPLGKLDVTGGDIVINTSTQYRTLNLYEGTTRRAYLTYDSTNNILALFAEESGSVLQFGTSNGERMRIDSSGGVLIGTTSNAGNVNLVIGGGSARARVLPATDNAGYIGESAYRWQAIYAVNGTIQTSDGREKNTIENSNLGLDFITSLRPVSFKWNVGENLVTYDEEGNEVVNPRAGVRTHYGLIAQEVKEAIPEGVDFGGFIQEPNDGMMSLRYHEFVAPLIKAIQEQQAQLTDMSLTLANANAIITEQSLALTDLKSRIETLESK